LLAEIPESLMTMKNLARINLDSNQLKTIPYCLKDMQNLVHLSLEKNPFSQEERNRIEKELGIKF
jgi:Leucine-rich repeat (LRR) protein